MCQVKTLLGKLCEEFIKSDLSIDQCALAIIKTNCNLFLWAQKSLPTLTVQIQNKILDVQRDLKNYQQGPPLEEEMMGQFLSKVRTITIKHDKSYLSINNVMALYIFIYRLYWSSAIK